LITTWFFPFSLIALKKLQLGFSMLALNFRYKNILL